MDVIAHHINRFYPHTKEMVLNKDEDHWGILKTEPPTDVVNLK